jgi:hypothetical protein
MSKETYIPDTKEVDESGGVRVNSLPVRRKPWWKFGGQDVSFVSVDSGYIRQSESASSSDTKLDDTQDHHVWETEESRDIYKPIEGYEGAHRFNPAYKWTPEEEKKLVRQLDWRIALPACIMFFALQLDRGNITQAISDTMLSK